MGLLSMWVMFGAPAHAARFSAGVPSPSSSCPQLGQGVGQHVLCRIQWETVGNSGNFGSSCYRPRR